MKSVKREVSSNLETNRNQVNRLPPTNLLALTARGFQSGSNPKHPRAYSEHPWDLNLRLSSPTDQSLSSEDPSVRHQKPIVSLYAPSRVLNGRDWANYRAPCCGILSFAMSAVLGMRRLQGPWSACKNFVARGISRSFCRLPANTRLFAKTSRGAKDATRVEEADGGSLESENSSDASADSMDLNSMDCFSFHDTILHPGNTLDTSMMIVNHRHVVRISSKVQRSPAKRSGLSSSGKACSSSLQFKSIVTTCQPRIFSTQ